MQGVLSLFSYSEGVTARARRRVREFIDEYKPRFVYVDFSGGKDSSATLAVVNDVTSSWVATYIHVVGQTHWVNVEAAYGVCKTLVHDIDIVKIVAKKSGDVSRAMSKVLDEYTPPLLVHIVAYSHGSGLDFWSAVEKYGFPVNVRKRWCCAKFKSDWLNERPPNGLYDGKPARYIVTGIRREESVHRRKKWKTHVMVFDKYVRYTEVVLSPLYDYSTVEVFMVLLEYGLGDVVGKQYELWARAPNCMLCPMMGRKALEQAVSNIEPGLRERVLNVLEKLKNRYRSNTKTVRIIDEWVRILKRYATRSAKSATSPLQASS